MWPSCVHISYWMRKTIGGKWSILVPLDWHVRFARPCMLKFGWYYYSSLCFSGNGQAFLLLLQQQDMCISIHFITSFLKQSKYQVSCLKSHFSMVEFKLNWGIFTQLWIRNFFLLQNVWVFPNYILLWLHGVIQLSTRDHVW